MVWDFDGTLVDTSARNLSVNRRIVADLTGRPWRSFPALASREAYEESLRVAVNWQEMYRRTYGFSDDDLEVVVTRWTPFQVSDPTPAPFFPGLEETVAALADLPQAIVSQNARPVIEAILSENGLAGRFDPVIGYAEVGMQRQKPAPDGLIRCVDALGLAEPGVVLYVGDHEADALFVANAARDLADAGRDLQVLSVAALFANGASVKGWQIPPDHVVRSPTEVLALARRLDGPA